MSKCIGELTAQQRAGLAIWLLMQSPMTVRELSKKLQMTTRGTRTLLHNLEGTSIPLVRSDEGLWLVEWRA